MKTILKVIFSISILTSGYCFSQTWPKYYSKPNNDSYSDDIIETYDKGYLICGNYNGYYGSDFKQWSWLIKTDINGNILWDKIIEGGDEFIRTGAIEPTDDGGILTCGLIWTNEGNSDPYVMKLNSCGEKEWCKIFTGSTWELPWAQDIKVLSSGEIIVLLNQYEGTDAVSLLKLSSAGNYLWIKSYCKKLDYPHSYAPLGDKLKLTLSNALLISGEVYWADPWNPYGPLGLRPMLVMVDSLANEDWVLPFGLNDTILGQAHHVIEISDNIFLSVGRYVDVNAGINRKGLIMYFDKFGNEINHNIYDFSQLNENFNVGLFYDIKQIDSTFVLASYFGNTEWVNTAPPGELMSDTSAILNIKNYSHYLNNNEPYNIDNVFSNKIIHCSVYEPPNNWDIFLTKLNLDLDYDTAYNGNFTYDSLCQPGPPQSGFIFLDDCDIITGTEIPSPEEYYSFIATIPITAFPNPASSEITLAFQNTDHHTNMLLECYNIYGRQVHTEKIWKGQQETKIDLRDWAKGLYFAVVKSEGTLAGSVRFIRQ